MKQTIRLTIEEYLWRYRYAITTMACVLTVIGVLVTITLSVQGRKAAATSTKIQAGIAEEIIRFHVLANSDSDADQDLKMTVKENVVAYMSELLADAQSIDETRACIKAHLSDIEEYAAKVISENGYEYAVTAELTTCYFPMKSYGDCTFPAGDYEALRVCIGKAAGKNWWCVLYPNLCFIDSIHAVVPEEQKEELKNILTEEEYNSLLGWKDHEYKVTTKWFGNK